MSFLSFTNLCGIVQSRKTRIQIKLTIDGLKHTLSSKNLRSPIFSPIARASEMFEWSRCAGVCAPLYRLKGLAKFREKYFLLFTHGNSTRAYSRRSTRNPACSLFHLHGGRLSNGDR